MGGGGERTECEHLLDNIPVLPSPPLGCFQIVFALHFVFIFALYFEADPVNRVSKQMGCTAISQ